MIEIEKNQKDFLSYNKKGEVLLYLKLNKYLCSYIKSVLL